MFMYINGYAIKRKFDIRGTFDAWDCMLGSKWHISCITVDLRMRARVHALTLRVSKILVFANLHRTSPGRAIIHLWLVCLIVIRHLIEYLVGINLMPYREIARWMLLVRTPILWSIRFHEYLFPVAKHSRSFPSSFHFLCSIPGKNWKLR